MGLHVLCQTPMKENSQKENVGIQKPCTASLQGQGASLIPAAQKRFILTAPKQELEAYI